MCTHSITVDVISLWKTKNTVWFQSIDLSFTIEEKFWTRSWTMHPFFRKNWLATKKWHVIQQISGLCMCYNTQYLVLRLWQHCLHMLNLYENLNDMLREADWLMCVHSFKSYTTNHWSFRWIIIDKIINLYTIN
jgi:uncharacterized membrane protein